MKQNEIILSRGIHQMIVSHIRKDKDILTSNKEKLMAEMRSAKIVPSKSIPQDVVGINTKVQIKDLDTEDELVISLVSPAEEKVKRNKLSILSPFGLALVGYNEGDQVDWETPEGIKRYRIEKVSLVE